MSRNPQDPPVQKGTAAEPRLLARLLSDKGVDLAGRGVRILSTEDENRVWTAATAAALDRDQIVQTERLTASPVVAHLIQLEGQTLLERVTSDPACHLWPVVEGLLFHAWEIRFESMHRVLELAEAAHIVVSQLDTQRYGEQPVRELEILCYAYLAKAQGRVVGAREARESLRKERELLEESRERGFVVDKLVEQVVLLSEATDLWERERYSECAAKLVANGAEEVQSFGSSLLAAALTSLLGTSYVSLGACTNSTATIRYGNHLNGLASPSLDEVSREKTEFNRAATLIDLGRPAEALGRFDELEREFPAPAHRAYIAFNRARALSRLGRSNEAIDQLNVLLEGFAVGGAESVTHHTTLELSELMAKTGELAAALELANASALIAHRFDQGYAERLASELTDAIAGVRALALTLSTGGHRGRHEAIAARRPVEDRPLSQVLAQALAGDVVAREALQRRTTGSTSDEAQEMDRLISVWERSLAKLGIAN